MLGDIILLTIMVKDIEAASKRFETLFDLKVERRGESDHLGGIKNAWLRLGKGYIELIQPISPDSAAGRFLESHGEGVYLVGFDVEDIAGSVKTLRERGASVTQPSPEASIAWVHPKEAHGVFIALRKPIQPS